VSSITIPDVDDALKARLAARAARRGKSPESEARDILSEALRSEEGISRPANLYAAIRSVMEPLGGVEFDIPPRGPVREPPQLG
jgi:plasmid stability protein